MPPSKQQYKMHECCKAVNELKAMTSVISRYNLPCISHLPEILGYPPCMEVRVTLWLDWRPKSSSNSMVPTPAWRSELPYDSIGGPKPINRKEDPHDPSNDS